MVVVRSSAFCAVESDLVSGEQMQIVIPGNGSNTSGRAVNRPFAFGDNPEASNWPWPNRVVVEHLEILLLKICDRVSRFGCHHDNKGDASYHGVVSEGSLLGIPLQTAKQGRGENETDALVHISISAQIVFIRMRKAQRLAMDEKQALARVIFPHI
jgi:hypothetical protein